MRHIGYNAAPEPGQTAALLCGILALWPLLRRRRADQNCAN